MLKSAGLTGRSDNRVDSKGRLSVPVTMRKVLAPNDYDEVAVVLAGTSHLILLNREYYTETIQQSIFDKASAKGDNPWRSIARLSENTNMSTIDSQGRITIPSRYLENSDIRQQAVVIGAFDRVLVWNPDKYVEWLKEEDVDSSIAELGIL